MDEKVEKISVKVDPSAEVSKMNEEIFFKNFVRILKINSLLADDQNK